MDNASLFPACLPYREDFLKVSDLHTLFYEECGNPNGVPVVYLHGGPGGGISPAALVWVPGTVTVTDDLLLTVRVLNGTQWSALANPLYLP
ncbi:MAG: hypothetical protein V4691_07775, partial [Pseudomonadota bacterium]